MNKRWALGIIGLGLMAATGFSQMPGDPAMPGMEGMFPPDFVGMNPDELMARADTLLQQGDTNGAVNTMMSSYEAGLQQNARRFSTVLNNLLTTGHLPEAERLYQNDQAQRDALTRDYYNRLHEHYVSQGDKQALLKWTAEVWTKTLPPDLRTASFGWLIAVSREVGPIKRVLELVPVCIANFDAPTARDLLSGVVGAYDGAGDQATANKVLNAIESAARGQAELSRMVAAQRVNLLFSAKHWKEAEARFQKEAPGLPDGELAGCWQHAQGCMRGANQRELLDHLCTWILKEQKDKAGTWQAVAAAWLQNAKERKAVAEIPVRLDALLQMGCANTTVRSYYFQYWALVAKDGKPADLAALQKLSDRLTATFADKKEKELLRPCALNNYFLLEDYEAALRLLKEPLPEMEPGEHEIAINKLKAHIALKKGDKQEALERFRKFMETVKTWTEPEFDPLTEMEITREMCLGLNAKRIGDILGSLNDAKASQAAYREAQDYYASAQKSIKPDSPEGQHINERQAELGKLLKK